MARRLRGKQHSSQAQRLHLGACLPLAGPRAHEHARGLAHVAGCWCNRCRTLHATSTAARSMMVRAEVYVLSAATL